FLVLEGVNGAGKTSLLNKISDYISNLKFEVVKSFEPGSSKAGIEIRKLILSGEYNLNSLSETFLFAADRTEHVNKVIKTNLEKNKIVISDRYYYSSIAFQGYGRKQDLDFIKQVNQKACSGTYPDLVILLDLDPKVGLQRTKKRQDDSKDSFEDEEIEFHNNLREGFLEIAKSSNENFLIINAEKTEEEIWLQVKDVLDLWAKSLKND
ncbi:UNVERIFIED_CONTAM: hypothetical protein GTU68_029893, partial [Idotea baltica]|nr:hypothetical protein [Idotea baltica]